MALARLVLAMTIAGSGCSSIGSSGSADANDATSPADAGPAPCSEGSPGLRIVIELGGLRAQGPADFSVVYSNGTRQLLLDDLPPFPWTGHVEGAVRFDAHASSGTADFALDARPDPGVGAGGFRDVDVTTCSSVSFTAVSLAPDAGPDAAP